MNSILIIICLTVIVTNLVHGEDISDPNHVLNWKAPEELVTQFPYALAGHNEDGVPVWIIPGGKHDVRTYFENGGDSDLLIKYSAQMLERFTHPELFSPKDNPQSSFIIIMDMDGYEPRQLSHIPTVQYSLTSTRMFVDILKKSGKAFQKGYIVNNNFVFQTLWTLLKPIMGNLADNIELYGTTADKWKPILLKDFSKSVLPPQLGGSDDHKDIETFG